LDSVGAPGPAHGRARPDRAFAPELPRPANERQLLPLASQTLAMSGSPMFGENMAVW
jgi:hypothetical protein